MLDFRRSNIERHADDPTLSQTPVTGRIVLACLLFGAAFAVSLSYGLPRVNSAIVGLGCVALFEWGGWQVRKRMRSAQLDRQSNLQANAEEDARIAREKAIAAAKARGDFDRFGKQ